MRLRKNRLLAAFGKYADKKRKIDPEEMDRKMNDEELSRFQRIVENKKKEQSKNVYEPRTSTEGKVVQWLCSHKLTCICK